MSSVDATKCAIDDANRTSVARSSAYSHSRMRDHHEKCFKSANAAMAEAVRRVSRTQNKVERNI